MSRQKFSKRKKAAGGTRLQQPKMQRAATVTTGRKSTLESAAEQAKVNAATEQAKVNGAVNQLIENSPVSYETGFWRADRNVEFFRGKLYQLGRLKQFLYLFNEEWVRVLPNDVRRVLRQRGQSGSLARWYLSDWQTVCLGFGQIIWLKDIKELKGKGVVA